MVAFPVALSALFRSMPPVASASLPSARYPGQALSVSTRSRNNPTYSTAPGARFCQCDVPILYLLTVDAPRSTGNLGRLFYQVQSERLQNDHGSLRAHSPSQAKHFRNPCGRACWKTQSREGMEEQKDTQPHELGEERRFEGGPEWRPRNIHPVVCPHFTRKPGLLWAELAT